MKKIFAIIVALAVTAALAISAFASIDALYADVNYYSGNAGMATDTTVKINPGQKIFILGWYASPGKTCDRVVWFLNGEEKECSDNYRDRTEIAGLEAFQQQGFVAENFIRAGFGHDTAEQGGMMELLGVDALPEGTYTAAIKGKFTDGTYFILKDDFTLQVGDGNPDDGNTSTEGGHWIFNHTGDANIGDPFNSAMWIGHDSPMTATVTFKTDVSFSRVFFPAIWATPHAPVTFEIFSNEGFVFTETYEIFNEANESGDVKDLDLDLGETFPAGLYTFMFSVPEGYYAVFAYGEGPLSDDYIVNERGHVYFGLWTEDEGQGFVKLSSTDEYPSGTPKMAVDNISARSGDTVSIDVSIENNPGILGATVKLNYADGLTLTQVENGNAFGDLTVPANLRSGCTLTWDAIDIDPAEVVSEGTVVTLTFNVTQGLDDNVFLPISITYEPGDIIDLNLESVDLEIESGGVTIFNYTPGDVNNDGRINSLDVILIRRYIVDGCTTDPEGYDVSLIEAAADVNDDGTINSLDVIMIRRFIADGGITDPQGYNIVLKPSTHFSGSGSGNGGQQGDDPEEPPTDANGLAYTNNGNGTCTITGIGTCTETDLIIPETIDGLTVVEIGFKAFSEQTGLTSIQIPETVETIGARAFYGCTGLTEITIPSSVYDIGTQVLYKASNIHTVYYNSPYFPSNETENQILSDSGIKKVVFGGDVPFYAARNLGLIDHVEEVEICEGATYIDGGAFNGCDSLVSVSVPDSIDYIGASAFYNCTNLISIVIPENVTTIEYQTFYNCSNLSGIVIPESVTSIGSYAFYGCVNLISVEIPDSVTSIGTYAFANCSGLQSVSIPDSIALLDAGLFSNCSSLIEVLIPDSVNGLGYSIFNGCSSLETVWISDSVTAIGASAFAGCFSLTEITIPDSISVLSTYIFRDCTDLTSVNIPDSVTRIETNAFINCPSLTDVWYGGDYLQWQDVVIYSGNECLQDAEIHYMADDEIVSLARNLAEGETLVGGPYALTGVVTQIITPYNADYGNVTLMMTVCGEDIQCYRLVNGISIEPGDGVESVAIGDTITVAGEIKNYRGTIEFIQNCTLEIIIHGT